MSLKSQKNDKHLFPFLWSKEDYPQKNGLKVLTTFACGGGSTMGYKLAGFEVIAANDIDPQMAKIYKHNHNPKYFFEAPISDLLEQDLPKELYDIDILDGSPPCSVFSTSGSREKAWQKDKHFREGQAKQVLDDLFFDFIEVAEKLKPKVIVAENVKGMLLGNAKWYTREVFRKLDEIGYTCQVFLLNSAFMGVPQRRERVFFIASRKDLDMPQIKLNFSEQPISLNDVYKQVPNQFGKKLTETYEKLWNLTPPGQAFSFSHPKNSFFSAKKPDRYKPLNTILATEASILAHDEKPYSLSNDVFAACTTFPIDYEYLDIKPQYLLGMSVPPIMMSQVANQIAIQLFSKKGII